MKPLSNGRVPIQRSSYPAKNNPEANYGYSELAKDKAFARQLNRVADNLNIPGQWLADIMAYENDTFSPSRYGGSNNHYVGLIQFGEDAATDMGTTRAYLASLSRVEQLKYVEKYLKMRPGPLTTMEHVYMKINQGNSLGAPSSWASARDGNGGLPSHFKGIGSHAGRRYQTSFDGPAPLHTSYRPGCATCQSLSLSGNATIPHRGT